MGNSLQDQLLKAGLVSEDQVEKARAKPRPRPKPGSGKGPSKPAPKKAAGKSGKRGAAARKGKPSRPETPEDRERRELREMERQRSREAQQQQVNSRKIQERREKAKAFLNDHQVNVTDGDIPYHFTVGSRIRHLYVNGEQREALLAGKLLVASIGKRDFIFPGEHREALKALDPDVPLHDASAEEAPDAGKSAAAEEDPYKDYQVPDDLMW